MLKPATSSTNSTDKISSARTLLAECTSGSSSNRPVRMKRAVATGDDARIGIETGAMTPWLVHELRNLGLEVVCLGARQARAALKMQINKTDQNDAEGLAQTFVPDGTGLFMSSRSTATARVLFSVHHGPTVPPPEPRRVSIPQGVPPVPPVPYVG